MGTARGQHPPLPIHTHPLCIHVWSTLSSHTPGDLTALPGSSSFHPAPAQTPRTLGSPPKLCILPTQSGLTPTPVSLTESQPGPADTNRAIGSQSRNDKSQHLGRAVGLGGSESSLGTAAIPSCPSAQLRDDPWRPLDKRRIHLGLLDVRSPEG